MMPAPPVSARWGTSSPYAEPKARLLSVLRKVAGGTNDVKGTLRPIKSTKVQTLGELRMRHTAN